MKKTLIILGLSILASTTHAALFDVCTCAYDCSAPEGACYGKVTGQAYYRDNNNLIRFQQESLWHSLLGSAKEAAQYCEKERANLISREICPPMSPQSSLNN